MSDLQDLIALREACALIPGTPHWQTVRRWVKTGARGRKLHAYVRGGRVFISRRELDEFIRSAPAPHSAGRSVAACR